jgi:hypothetical protein
MIEERQGWSGGEDIEEFGWAWMAGRSWTLAGVGGCSFGPFRGAPWCQPAMPMRIDRLTSDREYRGRMNEEVSACIAQAPDTQRHITESVRELVHRTVGNVREEFKWGRPVFTATKDFAHLKTAKAYATCGFMHANELHDPKGLLEGSGKAMRHIKLRTLADVDDALLERWLRSLTRSCPSRTRGESAPVPPAYVSFAPLGRPVHTTHPTTKPEQGTQPLGGRRTADRPTRNPCSSARHEAKVRSSLTFVSRWLPTRVRYMQVAPLSGIDREPAPWREPVLAAMHA